MSPSAVVSRSLVLLAAGVPVFIAVSGPSASRADTPRPGERPAATHADAPDPALARLVRELKSHAVVEPWRMAEALVQVGDHAAARAILQRALREADEPASVLNEPFSLQSIAEVQSQLGDRGGALKTLLRARGAALTDPRRDWSQTERLGQIAAAQVRLSDRAAARETFQQALRFAGTLSPHDKELATREVVKAQAAAGDLDSALTTAASIPDSAQRLDALAAIDVNGTGGDKEVLGRFLRMIDAEQVPPEEFMGVDVRKGRVLALKVDVLIGTALAEARADERAGAMKSLQEAERVAATVQEPVERNLLDSRVVSALVNVGAGGEASRIAGAVGDPYFKTLLLTVIAEARSQAGDREATLKAWSSALDSAKTSAGRYSILMRIAETQIGAKDTKSALETLRQASLAAEGIKPGDQNAGPFTSMGFETDRIAQARARAGDIGGALRMAETIKNTQVRGDTLAGIAAAQAKAGDIKGALRTAEAIRPPGPGEGFVTHLMDKNSAVLGVLSAQAEAGDVNGALFLADRLGPNEKYVALLVIAEGVGRQVALKR
jgi:predicted negative regulator of RcsB-dependent stress response